MYTGDGKGKSTAAFGLALRARGADLKVHLIQFIKNKLYSEIETLLKIGVTVRQFGCGLILGRPVSSQDIAEARKGLREIDRLFAEAAADVLILDEVNIALARGLLEETVFHSILDGRPRTMEVICTGRGAPESLIRRADLVTEMRAVKHYYQAGVPSRDGIER